MVVVAHNERVPQEFTDFLRDVEPRLRQALVSTYGPIDGREATVDASRGRAGSWRKVMEACDRLDRVGRPRVVIACILHAGNAAEIPELLAWVKSRGYELVVQPLYQNFGDNAHEPGWWRRSHLWPTDLAPIDEALDVLIAERRSGGKVCNDARQLEGFRGYFRAPGVLLQASHFNAIG